MIDPGAVASFVVDRLEAHRDQATATATAAYMKTEMPSYGVKAATRRRISRTLISQVPVQNADEVWLVTDTLWGLSHREEKYLAIGFLRHHAQWLNGGALTRVSRLIVEGAWWDFVDEIAAHIVGPIVRADPAKAWPVIERWNLSDDLWLRRSSIICQLGSREATDQDRLFAFCLARAADPEFFIRKAIGWALRQYARTDPHAVRAFLHEHGAALSNLSRREASRRLSLCP